MVRGVVITISVSVFRRLSWENTENDMNHVFCAALWVWFHRTLFNITLSIVYRLPWILFRVRTLHLECCCMRHYSPSYGIRQSKVYDTCKRSLLHFHIAGSVFLTIAMRWSYHFVVLDTDYTRQRILLIVRIIYNFFICIFFLDPAGQNIYSFNASWKNLKRVFFLRRNTLYILNIQLLNV